jgi:hypothetical protein
MNFISSTSSHPSCHHKNARVLLTYEKHVSINIHKPLAISYRVQFKLCSFMHSIHNGRSPAYLTDIVQATSTRSSCSGLRSAATTNYILPRLRTKFGERAFSHAGPATWNALPPDLCDIPVSTTFKRQLKTHFLKLLIICCSSNFDSCNAHMFLIVMWAILNILSLTSTLPNHSENKRFPVTGLYHRATYSNGIPRHSGL